MHKLSAAIMKKYKEEALCFLLDEIHERYCCGAMSHALAEYLLENLLPAELVVWSYINKRAEEVRDELKESYASTKERWELMGELARLEKEIGDAKKRTIELYEQYTFTFDEDTQILDEALSLLVETVKEDPGRLKHLRKFLKTVGSEELVKRFNILMRLDAIEESLGCDPTSKKRLKLIREKLQLRKALPSALPA